MVVGGVGGGGRDGRFPRWSRWPQDSVAADVEIITSARVSQILLGAQCLATAGLDSPPAVIYIAPDVDRDNNPGLKRLWLGPGKLHRKIKNLRHLP